jgi:hypothetical protein
MSGEVVELFRYNFTLYFNTWRLILSGDASDGNDFEGDDTWIQYCH